jgi:diguanylate cyclase (GGDEF)-like protein/PAS domain S-box-containing protein
MRPTVRTNASTGMGERAAKLLRMEHAVTRCLAEADSESAALKAVMRAICETEGWECGRYWRVDEQAGVLRFGESWSEPDPTIEKFIASKRDAVYGPGVGLAGRAWRTGQPTWVADIGRDERSLRAAITLKTGMRGAFHFPVTAGGKTIGVLAFNSRDVRQPDERLLQAVGVIGSQVGQFLQRKQAEAVLRSSEERFRGLSNLSSDVYWEQDEQYRFTSFNGTGTDLVNPANLQWIGKKRWEQNYINLSAAEWAAHMAVLDARKPFRDLELCRRNAAGENIWVSISGEPVFDSAGQFTGYRGVGKDITERKREEQLRLLEHAVTRCLAEADSASGAVKGVLRAVCETEHWECGRYFEPDAGANVLRFHEAWCVPDPLIERFVEETRDLRFAIGVGLVGRAWQSGTPLWATDIANDPRTLKSAFALSAGMRGIFAVPVLAEGRALGVLAFSSSNPREPNERLLQAMRVIGSQIGQFLQRKQAEVVLRAGAEQFRAIFEQAAVGITRVDLNGVLVEVNQKFCDMLGYAKDELLGRTVQEITHPDDYGQGSQYRAELAHGVTGSMSGEKRFFRKDGGILWARRTMSNACDAEGRPLYVISIVEDVTARKRDEQLLALEHAVTRTLAEADTAAAGLKAVLRTVCETEGWELGRYFAADDKAGVLRFGEAWGVPDQEIERFIVMSRTLTYGPGAGLAGRVWQSGEPLWVADINADARVSTAGRASESGIRGAFVFPLVSEGRIIGVFIFNSRAVREPEERLLRAIRVIGSQIGQFIQRKQAEDRVAQLAQFDTVTGLPNRHLFRDRLGQVLAQARRNDWKIGVLFVDLDRFKVVNDTYGHGVGDDLLRQVATRIKNAVRSADTVGRLSGDEFAVVLANLAKAEDAALVSQKIVAALAAPYMLEGHQTYITASIGIALFPGDGGEPEMLIKNADTAMYRAKEQGRDNYQFYLPQMNERLVVRRKLEAQLRVALERDEYRLHYQPKVSLATGAITGFEALLRWEHGGRLVSPAEFIPILEETGLIVAVGEWVIRTACSQIRQWERLETGARPIAVNLSVRQFQSRDLAGVVERALRETGVAPELLELELTETLLMSEAEESVQTLRQLKAVGVRLAVDDFGTGYSSLAYLRRFPLDTLKIDRAFIRDAISDPDDATITITIINLAHSMKLKVVAEGVETEGQHHFLAANHCDEMQGFYFARPLGAEECTRTLVEGRRLPDMPARAAMDVPTLLLVDDNDKDLVLLKRALEAENFNIATAASPAAAFEFLARDGADVVISDQGMSEMSGVEFLSKVRRMYPDTVRVIMTGGDAPTLTRAINAAGIHRFLLKSWNKDRLCSEVREAFRQREQRGKSTSNT